MELEQILLNLRASEAAGLEPHIVAAVEQARADGYEAGRYDAEHDWREGHEPERRPLDRR